MEEEEEEEDKPKHDGWPDCQRLTDWTCPASHHQSIPLNLSGKDKYYQSLAVKIYIQSSSYSISENVLVTVPVYQCTSVLIIN